MSVACVHCGNALVRQSDPEALNPWRHEDVEARGACGNATALASSVVVRTDGTADREREREESRAKSARIRLLVETIGAFERARAFERYEVRLVIARAMMYRGIHR